MGQSDKDRAGDVAHDGFEALMEGRDDVVAGSFMTKVEATIAHIIPDTLTAKQARKGSEPGSAKKLGKRDKNTR
jgi:uncharacterized protein